jgi:hypothetical protein
VGGTAVGGTAVGGGAWVVAVAGVQAASITAAMTSRLSGAISLFERFNMLLLLGVWIEKL